MILAVSLALAVATTPPADEAVALFESVCLNGVAELKPGEAVKIDTKGLPIQLRSLLGFISAGEPDAPGTWVTPDRLPKIAYRLSAAKQMYLIVPDAEAKSGYRSTCAVYVEGDHFFEGAKSVARIIYGTDAHISQPKSEEVSFGGGVSGYVVTVARDKTSTLIAAVKNPDYPNVGKPKE